MYLINNNLEEKNITSPEYIKEFDCHIQDINIFNNLIKNENNDYKKNLMISDLRMLEAGITGEKKIDYELRNSRIPMLIMHNLNLSYNNYTSQIDFILILNNYFIIIESKNFNGDLEINKYGDFIRYLKNEEGYIYKKECLYNPVTQNERHLELIKDILENELLIDNLDLYLKPIIVLTNSKTIIEDKYNYCRLHNIIRCDKLISFIKSLPSNNLSFDDNFLYEISSTLLKYNNKSNFMYQKKYREQYEKSYKNVSSIYV